MTIFSEIINGIIPKAHPIKVEKEEQFIHISGKRMPKGNYGKWIIDGDMQQILQWIEILKPYIENMTIPGIKYTHKEGTDNFPLNPPTLFVYCNDEEKDKVGSLLNSLDIHPRAFILKNEAELRWSKGGVDSLESTRQQLLRNLTWILENFDSVEKKNIIDRWKELEAFYRLEADIPTVLKEQTDPRVAHVNELMKYNTSEEWSESKREIETLQKIFSIKYVKDT
jgi:hypothetical protein